MGEMPCVWATKWGLSQGIVWEECRRAKEAGPMAGDGLGRETSEGPRCLRSATGSIVKGQVSGTETVGTGGETAGRGAGRGRGAMDGTRAGRKVGSGTAEALCPSLVLSACGRNGSPRECLGESDRVQMGCLGQVE